MAAAAAAAVVGARAVVPSSSASSSSVGEAVARVSAVARYRKAAPALLGSVCRAPPALRRSRRGEAAAVRQTAAASAVEAVASAAEEDEDETLKTFEVELRKPIGVTFGKGVDGGTYVLSVVSGGNAEEAGLRIGDRVLETSATFGTDMWPAAEYGRTMYAIKTRAGGVALVMTRPKTMIEFAEKSAPGWERERNAGNVGYDTKQRQMELYKKSKENERIRRDDLEEGLRLYKKGSYEDALVKFENVLGLDPTRREEAVSSYNVACCYSKLGKTIRSDPDLAAVRESPQFKPLIDQYDEPLINENAIKAVKSLFGMFGKK
eukprot:jgi/Chlat1/3538/Chrsp23S03712